MGLSSPSRYIPTSPPMTSRPGAPLLGFLPLQCSWSESPRLDGFPYKLPGFPGFYQQFPLCRLRRRSQAFSTSQRLFPLIPVQPFSDCCHSWGSSPSGVCSSFVAPSARHRWHAFLALFPQAALALFPRKGSCGHRPLRPRFSEWLVFAAFKAFVCEGIGLRPSHTLMQLRPTFPSWVFTSSWLSPPPTRQAIACHPLCFTKYWFVSESILRCVLRSFACGSCSSLARGPFHLEVLCLSLNFLVLSIALSGFHRLASN